MSPSITNNDKSNNIRAVDISCADSVLSGSNIVPSTQILLNYHANSSIVPHPMNSTTPPLNVPTIVNATNSGSKRGNDAIATEREQILNAPLPPLVAPASEDAVKRSSASETPKKPAAKPRKPSSKESGKRGRRSDPRMNRAVAARLANPTMSLLEALKVGGFDFPDLEPNRAGNPSTKDADNVQLAQRKNQLSRRLRQARLTMEKGGSVAAAIGNFQLEHDDGNENTSDMETSRTSSTPSNYKRRERRKGKYRRDKNPKYRKERRSSSRRSSRHSRKKSKSRRKRREYDGTTDDTEYDSSDSYSSSSSSSYSSSSSSSVSGKNKGEDEDRKHKNKKASKQSKKTQKAGKAAAAPAMIPPAQAAFLQHMKQEPGQPYVILPQLAQSQFSSHGPMAMASVNSTNLIPQRPPSAEYQAVTNPPLPQHSFRSGPPKKKIKHRSGDSVASGSVASQSIASAASTPNSKKAEHSMSSSLTSQFFSKADPPVPSLAMGKDQVDGMQQAAAAQQVTTFDHDTVSYDPKLLQALDYYRSESANLYKRCLIMVGYTTVETEECDQVYLNFTAKAIRDDIVRWKRLRSFYLQCQLMHNAGRQEAQPQPQPQELPQVEPPAKKILEKISTTPVIPSPHKSDEANRNMYIVAKKDKVRSSTHKIMAKEQYQRSSAMVASTKDTDTTSHDRTEESEFTRQLEDIDTVSQLSNFDTISDFGSKNSYFSRHIHRLLGKSGPVPPSKSGNPPKQLSSQEQQRLSIVESATKAMRITSASGMQSEVTGGEANIDTLNTNKWTNSKAMDNLSCAETRTTSEDKSNDVMKSAIGQLAVSKPATAITGQSQPPQNKPSSSDSKEKQPQSKSEWNSDLLSVSDEQGDTVLTGLMKLSS